VANGGAVAVKRAPLKDIAKPELASQDEHTPLLLFRL
jgi:hypothetical protein